MIGIIGFGRFGKLASHYLAQDFEVFVYNRADKSAEINLTGARSASLETVCRQDVVIPCVPISIFRNLLKDIAPLIKPDALVIDVCSVKEYPIRWMTADPAGYGINSRDPSHVWSGQRCGFPGGKKDLLVQRANV